jgi:hypothetical protein
MRPVGLDLRPSRARVVIAVVSFASAWGTGAAFLLAHWNTWSLAVLHDHRHPLPYLALLCVLTGIGVWVLLPPGQRLGGAGWTAGIVVVALAGALCVVTIARPVLYTFAGSPEEIERRTIADGRYRLMVIKSLVMIDPEWDFVVERRVGGYVREQWMGCIYFEAGEYRRLLSFEPGRIRIETSEGPVEIRFNPQNLRVTMPLPKGLC